MYMIIKRTTPFLHDGEPMEMFPFKFDTYKTFKEALVIAGNTAAYHAESIFVELDADREKGIFTLFTNNGTKVEYIIKMIKDGHVRDL